MNPPETLVSLAGARETLGVSKSTLRPDRGRHLPVVCVTARRRLVDPADLRGFIERRKRRHFQSDDDPAETGSRVQISAGDGGGDEKD
jgi:hypothetical protein